MADGDSSVDDLISASINMSKIEEHIFSQDHVRNGIMSLGTDKKSILDNFFAIAKANSSKWVAGSNEIRTHISGMDVTIRFYVNNNQLMNLDGFVGYSDRVIGNLIKY